MVCPTLVISIIVMSESDGEKKYCSKSNFYFMLHKKYISQNSDFTVVEY